MSESESTPQPRRSQRDKRQVTRLGQDESPLKRKRGLEDDDDALEGREDDGEVAMASADEDEEPDYRAAKTPSKPVKQARKRASPSKPKTAAPKKPRARKAKGAVDLAQVAKETNISDDNALFNAILNPAAALQTTVEDFLESFNTNSAAALADLITCVLRCCGSNDTLDSDQVTDLDGIVDALDTLNDELKKEDSPVYPLNSKLAVFKTFRKSLSEFLSRLVQASNDAGILHESDIVPTIQAWIIAMSSSTIRSFRHTATAIALETQSALCQVAASTDAELEMIQRQRDGERKKKGKGASSGREKDLDKKAAEVKAKRTKLTELIREFFDGVFVHRYRDLDPAIRADCVQALGKWIITHSSYFLDGSYLRYAGWVLSDPVSSVRLAAVKALATLYAKKDYAVSLGHFTDRFKKRMVEMACRDTDLTIRVATIGLLGNIEQLEDEEREKVCLLIFDGEARVRKAVSSFVKGVWEEAVEDKMVGQSQDDTTRERVGIKCLAELLVKWSKTLDQEDEVESQTQTDSWQRPKEVSWLVTGNTNESRIALVVDALSDDVDAMADWQPLLDDLLLDHSAVAEDNVGRKSKKSKATKSSNSEETVDDVWRLDEVEEGVMLEVLVATLVNSRCATIPTATKKGKDKQIDDASASETTRALIKSLPRLISKHQTYEGRIAEVLLIPQVMNIDMYLEMRMVPAYEALWDAIIQQFLTHSATATLMHAVTTMNHMLAATTLSATNATKIQELDEALAVALRDAVSGRDELEITSFSQDETRTLAAVCARVSILGKSRDMTAWMEDEDDGKQSSAWDIFSTILERGTLGYEEEEKMMVDILDALTMHLIWKFGNLSTHAETTDSVYKEKLCGQRDSFLERIVEYAAGGNSNVLEEVKRTAFQHALSLYSLFRPALRDSEEPTLLDNEIECEMPDETQYRFAGFVQSQLERYADELVENREPPSKLTTPALSDDEDYTQTQKSSKKGKQRLGAGEAQGNHRAELEREYEINSIVSSFIRAIRVRVINVRHAGIILSHYGRLDPIFDTCVKTVVDILREEGMLNSKGELVVSVALHALRESFNLFLEGNEVDDSHTIALAKLLVSCFIIRGAQLTIVRRLEPKYLAHLHTTLITWIVPKIAGYHAVGDTKLRSKSLVFFRSLSPLLKHLESRDALQLKATLEQAIATAKLEVGSGKAWDPYHSYVKKLTPGTTKGKGQKRKMKAFAANGDVTSEDEGIVSQSENEDALPPPSQRRLPRPVPRPVVYREPSADDGDMENGAAEASPITTPRARRTTTTYTKTPQRQPLSDHNGLHQTPMEENMDDEHPIREEPNGTSSPAKAASRPSGGAVDPDVPNFKSRRKRIKV